MNFRRLSLVTTLAVASIAGTAHAATLLGPVGGAGLSGEYASSADSPFASVDFSSGYFHLEDFEDAALNTPGVTANTGNVVSASFGTGPRDGVDTDDGVLDGQGNNGDNWFSGSAGGGVTLTFDATILGALPTHAGLVWTDGNNDIVFEAFDALGVSLGVLNGTHADDGFVGSTADDRFYGAINADGISSIFIAGTGAGGIEFDHLQYGQTDFSASAVPIPAGLPLLLTGLIGLGILRGRRSNG